MSIGVTSQPIWIAITVGVFFAGIGVSYAVFVDTYDQNTMMGQGIIPEKEPVMPHPEKMTSASPLPDVARGPAIDFPTVIISKQINCSKFI